MYLRLEVSRKPLPRNGDVRPPVGLGGLDGLGESSLIIVNEVFLCWRGG